MEFLKVLSAANESLEETKNKEASSNPKQASLFFSNKLVIFIKILH